MTVCRGRKLSLGDEKRILGGGEEVGIIEFRHGARDEGTGGREGGTDGILRGGGTGGMSSILLIWLRFEIPAMKFVQ